MNEISIRVDLGNSNGLYASYIVVSTLLRPGLSLVQFIRKILSTFKEFYKQSNYNNEEECHKVSNEKFKNQVYISRPAIARYIMCPYNKMQIYENFLLEFIIDGIENEFDFVKLFYEAVSYTYGVNFKVNYMENNELKELGCGNENITINFDYEHKSDKYFLKLNLYQKQLFDDAITNAQKSWKEHCERISEVSFWKNEAGANYMAILNNYKNVQLLKASEPRLHIVDNIERVRGLLGIGKELTVNRSQRALISAECHYIEHILRLNENSNCYFNEIADYERDLKVLYDEFFPGDFSRVARLIRELFERNSYDNDYKKVHIIFINKDLTKYFNFEIPPIVISVVESPGNAYYIAYPDQGTISIKYIEEFHELFSLPNGRVTYYDLYEKVNWCQLNLTMHQPPPPRNMSYRRPSSRSRANNNRSTSRATSEARYNHVVPNSPPVSATPAQPRISNILQSNNTNEMFSKPAITAAMKPQGRKNLLPLTVNLDFDIDMFQKKLNL